MFQASYNESKRDPLGDLRCPSAEGSFVTYVQSVVRKLRLSEPQAFVRIFLQDRGEVVPDFFSSSDTFESPGWLFVEQFGEYKRVSCFKTLEGVSAQFCTKLLLQTAGAIMVANFDSSSGIPSLAHFRGSGSEGNRSFLMGTREACRRQLRSVGLLGR